MLKKKKKVVSGTKTKGKAAPAVDKPKFVLPSELSTPADALADYTVLIYGKKKIGKTTLTSNFDGAIHIMTEPGGKALKIYQVAARNWEQFKGWVRALEQDKSNKFRTVVVDTVDNAYKMAFEYVCKTHNFDHPSEEEWGKGWQAIKDEFTSVFNRILSLPGMGKIFISHSMEREVKTRLGKKYDLVMPTMPKQAAEILEAVVDVWCYYDYNGTDRVLTILGDDHVSAGHRLETRFRYADGTPIREIPMGRNATEAYKNFVAAFNNELKKGGSADKGKPTKPASGPTKKVVRKP